MTIAQKQPEPRRFRSLANTLIRSIAGAGVLCTLVVAILQIALTYREHRENFESEVRSIARINVPLLSVNLWDIEPDAIRRQLQLIAERPQIAYVRVEAVSGQKFEGGSPTHRDDDRTVTLNIPYPGEKPGHLGTLQVTPNTGQLYRALAGDVLRLLAGFALLIGLICIVALVILRRQLQLPMQHIADFAASLTPTQLTRPLILQRPERRWRDEIDEVADGFRVLQDDIRQHVEKLGQLVAQRTTELEGANQRLTAANEDKNRYLGIAAHDLRNPLSSMRGLSQLMLEMPLEPAQKQEFLETIHRTSDELLTLVNDLLDVAQIESGTLDLRREDRDVGKLVEERLVHLGPTAVRKNIAIKFETQGALTANIDAARFSQVIDNLISNAVKFSPAGTNVHVSVDGAAASVRFTVQDEGPGITDADRENLFKNFQKLSARPTGGEKSTGLGLAIVHKIVDAHGGGIVVEHGAQSGAKFVVSIPAKNTKDMKVDDGS